MGSTTPTDVFGRAVADFGKSPFEAWLTDVGPCVAEVRHAKDHVEDWMKPRSVSSPLVVQPARSAVRPEPLGVVLVIAPWNYPLQLVINPLAGVLAAGNTAVVKPSELAPATSALLAEMLPRYVDGVHVVEGAVPETTELLSLPFDHILFTGSTEVGRIVMRAAADNLVPVTLELGGKSPVVVDGAVDLTTAARRIMWGKLLNAGQTCIAPDYCLVDRAVIDRFVTELAEAISAFHGADPQRSGDLARIVNSRHHSRLTGLLDNHGGTVAVGGQADAEDRYLAPTVVVDPDPDSPLMQEEIFGPILPVVSVDGVHDAIDFIRSRPKPLALYVFTDERSVADRVLAATSSGSACVNHVLMQVAVPDLPFGGVGPAGMGRYHGQAGFDAMSNLRAVMRKPMRPDLDLAYPPYTGTKKRLVRAAVPRRWSPRERLAAWLERFAPLKS